MRKLLISDSVGGLGPDSAGAVVVTGSHGGVASLRYAARFGLAGLVCHDAAVGKDSAGIAGLAVMDAMGVPACAVLATSAPIGDAAAILRGGIIGHVGEVTAALGITPGQTAAEAVARLRQAPAAPLLPDGVAVLDSVTQAGPEHAGMIVVCGSHASASAVGHGRGLRLAAAFHNDAGGGYAALAGLDLWDEWGVPAGAVSCRTARIGDGQDTLSSGVLSAVNARAGALGLRAGMSVANAVRACRGERP